MSRNKITSKRKNKTKTKYTKKKAKEKKIWATYTGCLPSKSKKEKRKKRGGNVEQGKKKVKRVEQCTNEAHAQVHIGIFAH